MKKRVFLLVLFLVSIISFGASALDLDSKKKDNYTGWWFDKETQHEYYFKDGDITRSWFNDGKYWYYFDDNGYMKTGWIQSNNNWYYLYNQGAMATGWVLKDGKWYYFNTDGTMAHDTTIDGYNLGSNGAWVQ